MKGSILFLYESKKGDFPSRSCASVLLVLRGNVSSDLFILGAVSLMILFGTLLSRYFCTSVVWIVLMLLLISFSETVLGSVLISSVYLFLL